MNNVEITPLWARSQICTSSAVSSDFSKDYMMSISKPHPTSLRRRWKFVGDEMHLIFKKEWLHMLANAGLDFNSAMLFYRPAWYTQNHAHTDRVYNNNFKATFAVNFAIDAGDTSPMVWYDCDDLPPVKIMNEAGGTSDHWEMEKCRSREIARLVIGDRLTLVKVDVPHNIEVQSNPRWAVSLRGGKLDECNTWEDAVAYFLECCERIKA